MKYALLIACLASPALADRQTFPPVDEAAQDPTLVAFRDSLRAKVAARDLDAVLANSCPDIYLDYTGDGGRDELRDFLDIDPETLPEFDRHHAGRISEAHWVSLEETLSTPGFFDDEGEFWMPHQWQITLPADLDPDLAYFVSGQNVSLRQSPELGAPVLDLISHEVVIIRDFNQFADYQSVLLTDGTQGYMHNDFLWPMTSYRAALVKSDSGAWQLCTFTFGD